MHSKSTLLFELFFFDGDHSCLITIGKQCVFEKSIRTTPDKKQQKSTNRETLIQLQFQPDIVQLQLKTVFLQRRARVQQDFQGVPDRFNTTDHGSIPNAHEYNQRCEARTLW